MFTEAIKKVSEFTRPIHTISRAYADESIIPGAATIFFVNELGDALTCKHVASMIDQGDKISSTYDKFKKERDSLPEDKKSKKKLKELIRKYGYKKNTTVQIKNSFAGCVDETEEIEVIPHPIYDLAIIRFKGFNEPLYKNHAVFLKDSQKVEQGKYLCRLGYPFPEFSNFKYDKEKDDIVWTNEGSLGTPRFPIDGMITRHLQDESKKIIGIEMSTPGLRGQSGGPLFDDEGTIYGMQYETHHLHLGFDSKEKEIYEGSRIRKVSNYPFLHLGGCVHVDVIKSFLKEKNIKFYEN